MYSFYYCCNISILTIKKIFITSIIIRQSLRINKIISILGNYDDKNKIRTLSIPHRTLIIFALILLYFLGTPFEIQYSNAQIYKPDTTDIDATPISVVLMINEDKDGKCIF